MREAKNYDHTHTARRQPHQCPQIKTVVEEREIFTTTPAMASSSKLTVPIIASLVAFLLLLFASIAHCSLASQPQNSTATIFKLKKRIRAHLKKINKPSLKTIQSPDGDTIDCVPSHLQPAFDHPQLKGQRPLVRVVCVSENFDGYS